MNGKTLIAAALAAVLAAGAGVGSWWYFQRGAHAAAEPPKPVDYRYVTLDKIVVMLRAEGGDPRYMAVDLVFRCAPDGEARLKEQLPLLKSVAVRALSQLNRERAGALSIDDYQSLLSKAYRAAYAREQGAQPFSEVMVGKLIIE
ncbi:flagellar basal body-associated protein FliL [Chromobacterium alticapitis]|uniref:Flagellar basal body-associated protein FliL n=1 Tax=Chromobacterium alticapitis TaxID=2073169 RepID=A0A2S5DK12_9NEIS|nr:flagellar basal body-associated protein FliL [Chromobacterium alticapitis]POZ63384.1 flagellar basal body-associated protein FliL [Chromobacterium alticapitis]